MRNWFGGDLASWVFVRNDQQLQDLVQLGPGRVVTFWDAPTGGNQYTDLLVNGLPASSVTTSSGGDGRERGSIAPFQGPDDETVLYMWAEVAGAGARYLVLSHDLATAVNALRESVTGLEAAVAAKQDGSPDLTAIAGLSPSNDDLLQRKSGAWTARSPMQVAADLLATGLFGPGEPAIFLQNGDTYGQASGAAVYIGPDDPGPVADGSVWIVTSI